MKRIIVILLLMIHAAASSGTVISLHYCMDSFASVSIGHKEKKGCDLCGMDNRGCCHDDVKVIKLDNSQYLQTSTHSFPNHTEVVFNDASFLIAHPISHLPSADYGLHTSSFREGPPLFLMNCNFRI